MGNAPRFKLSVIGILPQWEQEKVCSRLQRRLNLSPQQADLLLTNQGPLCAELLDHEHAFRLKTLLLELGVDCAIKPAPLEGLQAKAERFQLHQPAAPERPPRAPVARSKRPSPVRTGRTPWRAATHSRNGLSVWPVAGLVMLLALVSWLFESPSADLSLAPGTQMASMLDSRPID
ncbi:MAG: hypothetical protein SV765_07230 [Pseudomonadota bacterium]|nr:hypothetical protein [Pseudomonadales bacterium]MDY6919988.1 hypothetical protein [Pseudomonadota bacterium]